MTKNQKIVTTVVAVALSLVFLFVGMHQADNYTTRASRTWGLLMGLGLPVLILGGAAYLWTLKNKPDA